ncbi:MAG TPA: HAD-IIIA family hydrolase, partial [Thermomicrobiales bacterium]|nr:HAD-IIIA family hydrolase [Thermomicrobiales bacterium]
MGARAIFLDRDGTLVEPRHYPARPADLVLYAGVGAELGRLQAAGFRLVVVTNQSGIARGYFTEDDLARMHAHLRRELARDGVRLDAVYHCPHHPDGAVPALARLCDCRKPAPGLLLRAAANLGLDPRRSWLVGDILDDIEAGTRAGCRTVLVDLGTEPPPDRPLRTPDFVAPDTPSALRLIRAVEGLGPAADLHYRPARWDEAAGGRRQTAARGRAVGHTRKRVPGSRAVGRGQPPAWPGPSQPAEARFAASDSEPVTEVSTAGAPHRGRAPIAGDASAVCRLPPAACRLRPRRGHRTMSATVELVRRFRGLRALVIGDAMLDSYVAGSATRLCREGPVPVVHKAAEEHAPGGAANVAANLSALGAEVAFLGLTGRDAAGATLRAALQERGVDDRWLVADEDAATLRKLRIVAGGQYVARLDDGETRGASAAACARLLAHLDDRFPHCDVVLISDYRYGAVADDLLARLGALRGRRRVPLVVDAKDPRRVRAAGATVVAPN